MVFVGWGRLRAEGEKIACVRRLVGGALVKTMGEAKKTKITIK